MLSKIMFAASVAIFIGTTVPSIARDAAHSPYPTSSAERYGGGENGSNPYTDRYGLGYSTSARHDPRDTNGF